MEITITKSVYRFLSCPICFVFFKSFEPPWMYAICHWPGRRRSNDLDWQQILHYPSKNQLNLLSSLSYTAEQAKQPQGIMLPPPCWTGWKPLNKSSVFHEQWPWIPPWDLTIVSLETSSQGGQVSNNDLCRHLGILLTSQTSYPPVPSHFWQHPGCFYENLLCHDATSTFSSHCETLGNSSTSYVLKMSIFFLSFKTCRLTFWLEEITSYQEFRVGPLNQEFKWLNFIHPNCRTLKNQLSCIVNQSQAK